MKHLPSFNHNKFEILDTIVPTNCVQEIRAKNWSTSRAFMSEKEETLIAISLDQEPID